MAAAGIVAVIGAVLATVSMVLLFCRLRCLPRPIGKGGGDFRISIVIPARNEASNLSRLLPTLNAQGLPPHEILVVDDQSSDGTADLATSLGARVVEGKDLPVGWYGKPWACQQGADAASGDWLLFLDADLELESDALERLAETASGDPTAVLSVCPWHRIEKGYEELSVFFNLLMLGGIGAFTWRGDRAGRIGLFGQSMLLSREVYEQIGGHETVKKTILENFELSRRCEELGVSRQCFSGSGSISMRMFPGGFGELFESWAKGFSSGAGLAAPMALLLSSIWLTGLMMITVCLFMLLFGASVLPVLVSYAVVALPMTWLFRQAGGFSPLNALIFPVSLLFYQGLFGVAIMRKRRKTPTQWKGRDVD